MGKFVREISVLCELVDQKIKEHLKFQSFKLQNVQLLTDDNKYV